MCECMKEMEDKLKEKLPELISEKHAGFTKLISVGLKHWVFSLSGKKTPPFLIEFEAKWEKTAKNGNVSEKKFPVSITPIYCPLCGEKYNK